MTDQTSDARIGFGSGSLRGGTASRRIVGAALGFPAAVIALVVAQPFVHGAALMRDPLVVAASMARAAGLPPDASCCGAYLGFVSTLGVMLWVTTAAILLFAALVVRAKASASADRAMAMSAGVLTLALAFDDQFMIHEFAGRVLPMGEKLVLGLIGMGTLLHLAAHRHAILASHAPLLAFSLACLAGSVMIDQLPPLGPFDYAIEDGLKLFGICAWAAFHVIRSLDMAAPALRRV